MASPGHRANILDAHFRDTAIGVSPHVPSSLSQGQPGGIYTQDFGVIITAMTGRPRSPAGPELALCGETRSRPDLSQPGLPGACRM